MNEGFSTDDPTQSAKEATERMRELISDHDNTFIISPSLCSFLSANPDLKDEMGRTAACFAAWIDKRILASAIASQFGGRFDLDVRMRSCDDYIRSPITKARRDKEGASNKRRMLDSIEAQQAKDQVLRGLQDTESDCLIRKVKDI